MSRGAAARGNTLNSDNDALGAKLDRIEACARAARPDEVARNLLHAYVACLTTEELCDAVAVHALRVSADVLGALRGRLVRMGRGGVGLTNIDALGLRLIESAKGKASLRIEGLLSQPLNF
jgi:hypothetical protein